MNNCTCTGHTGRGNFPLILHIDYNSEIHSRVGQLSLLNLFLNCSPYGEEGGNSLFLYTQLCTLSSKEDGGELGYVSHMLSLRPLMYCVVNSTAFEIL